MSRDKDQVIAIEFNAGKGALVRRKLKAMPKLWRVVTIFATLALLSGLVWLCLHSAQTALLSVIPVTMALAGSVLFLARDEIAVLKNGISFPKTLNRQLQHIPLRLWNELERAELLTPDTHPLETRSFNSSALRLVFRSGARVVLPLNRFTADSLEQFVAAIEKWGTECKKDEQLRQASRLFKFEACTPGADEGAYTKFWEEQLADSYSFSAFVPLARGSKLQQGRIVVQRELACGGFAAIYLVKDDGGNQRVLKESVMPPDSDPALLERVRTQFEREANILVKLSHESIARVFDHFVEDGRNYLLLEHINGPDLRELVRNKGVVAEATVLDWVHQLARTIAYLHEQEPPVLHRDITPDNIVVTPDERVVLIDFGAANEFIGTATGTLIGKQSYMSPEQIRGKASPQSDIYALGATMYFLLCGRDPEALGVKDVRVQNDRVSAEAAQLITDMTRLDAHQRIISAAALCQRLDEMRNSSSKSLATSV